MLPATADDPAPAEHSAPVGRWSPRTRLVALVLTAALVVVAAVVLTRDERPAPPPGSWTLVPHAGLGAWIDVYDWTETLGGDDPAVGSDDLGAMADAGVQTVYVQTAHERTDDDILEPDRLGDLIDRAHAEGLHVVAWYLPSFVDVDRDLRRLVAASELPVDGLGVDIEAVTVTDPVERNRRLLDLSTRLRARLGEEKALSAITLSSVHLQVVNPAFWPGYPWAELGAIYDVIQPMAYWTIRRGELRDGARYVGENVDRVRAAIGRDDVPIHPIGGIADTATVADLQEMAAVIRERDLLGGSLYDWATSTPEQWEALATLRR